MMMCDQGKSTIKVKVLAGQAGVKCWWMWTDDADNEVRAMASLQREVLASEEPSSPRHQNVYYYYFLRPHYCSTMRSRVPTSSVCLHDLASSSHPVVYPRRCSPDRRIWSLTANGTSHRSASCNRTGVPISSRPMCGRSKLPQMHGYDMMTPEVIILHSLLAHDGAWKSADCRVRRIQDRWPLPLLGTVPTLLHCMYLVNKDILTKRDTSESVRLHTANASIVDPITSCMMRSHVPTQASRIRCRSRLAVNHTSSVAA
nr:hypothetical protein CFP56_76999 [Quercus suber]